MPQLEENNDLRSIEVQEILGFIPRWIIRWGITVIFFLIVLFLFISWLIKYPDVIKGEVEISTNTPPITIVSNSTGKLESIKIQNNETIQKGAVVGNIDNVLKEGEKNKLEVVCNEIERYLSNNNLEDYQFNDSISSLGIAQIAFSTLKTDVLAYTKLIKESNTEFQIVNLKKQISNYSRLITASKKQLNTQKRTLKKAQEKFEIHKELYQKDMISKLEFYEKEKDKDIVNDGLISLEKNIIQQEITIQNLRKELNTIAFDYNKQKRDLLDQIPNNLGSIRNTLSNWKLNYQLTAPINGKLVYLDRLTENEFINSGQALFAIIPEQSAFVGYIKVNQDGFGKVRLNQQVKIKLNNYPYQEFGQLSAFVTEISPISKENKYLVKVEIPKGMLTSYKKEIVYIPEMNGTAEIITKDLRLIERIFNQFTSLFED